MEQMYKVFLNERKIVITSPDEITQNKLAHKFNSEAAPKDVKNWFQNFLINDKKQIILTHPDPEKFFKVFCKAFVNIPAAGGVVTLGNKILFILRNGKWDLPKGKADKGETPQMTALREVEEECGIKGHTIVKELPATYHIYKSVHKSDNYEWILKKTDWFEMSYSGKHPGTPEKNEGITEIKWFEKNELEEVWNNTYENLKQIISFYRC